MASAGCPANLGATLTPEGVNFAVFSAGAKGMDLCLFTPDGKHEHARIPFADRDGDIWHMFVSGLGAGARYGFRAHGPYAPEKGQRFNANKLLMDPYARAFHGALRWSDALMGFKVGAARTDLSFDPRDSAGFMPKSVVTAAPLADDGPRPRHAWQDTVIYEAHAKGLTMQHPAIPAGLRGRYLGLCAAPMLDHLHRLGVTAIELLPVHSFIDDRFLVSKGLRNYWGYQTLGFFAPDMRYARADALAEFAQMVRSFHGAGIEVILDVVYNHSGEGDELGPTLCFRGLDNASYYRLRDGGRYYINDTGTGNTLDLTHPQVLRMVMDSLRFWAGLGVDGFRFDLGTVLGREAAGFDPGAGLLDAIRQDPVLAHVKLIAEPWDIGPGGYQLGNFPHPFAEWNDRFRDGARRFWRGDAGMAPAMAEALLGSAGRFDHANRPATASVNFIAAHDGFTLADLTQFTVKRNLANGEDNRDGHSDNHSDNLGVEGPSDDPAVMAARGLRARNLAATVLLAQGTPMWLAGDELGNSQGGNNNAYAQDNPTGWITWDGADDGLTAFVSLLMGLRKRFPALRQKHFLHAAMRADGFRDVIWRRSDGAEPSAGDWHDPSFRCIGLELRLAAADKSKDGTALYLVFNGGAEIALTLPDLPGGWRMVLDTTDPLSAPDCPVATPLVAPAQSVLCFVNVPEEGATP